MPMEWWDDEVATTTAEVARRHADNRVAWDQAAGHYEDEFDDDVALLRTGGSTLHAVERAVLEGHLGPFDAWCEVAVHLQCASGRDTLSLLNEGVERVVGVDISERHIANARRRSEALAADAAWYACDVLDAPHDLDGTADLVYTGRGAISWVHDLAAWARVVARILRPGGHLSLFDDHPTSFLFDPDEDHLAYNGIRYFDAASSGRGWQDSYIGDLDVDEPAVWHDRIWTFQDLFGALMGAGLTIVHLGEHPETYWDAFPEVPVEEQRRIPQTMSILARRDR